MDNYSLAPHVLAIISLFFIASISAIALRKIKIPYTIGLVVIGVVLAYTVKDVEALNTVKDIQLSHDVILYILLPTLIFDAAINIDSKLLFKNLVPILELAIPGVLVSTIIVGFIVNLFTPLSMAACFLFGALISATDPVAVVSLFKEIKAPERLDILVDGESLFNDATAIVLFNIIVVFIISQSQFSFANVLHGTVDFFKVFFGGILTGTAVGFAIIQIIKIAKNDPIIDIALSTVLAYSAFIIAEYYMEVSGVMAVLAAGIILSWYSNRLYTPEIRKQVRNFWEYATFVCNSFIFILLGVAEMQLILLVGKFSGKLFIYIAAAVVAITVARLFIVFVIPYIFPFKFEKINVKYKTIMFWGGLRGAVPLALVLSLSPHFENQPLLVELTLGVVLFTLLIQGTTVKPLMKMLNLKR